MIVARILYKIFSTFSSQVIIWKQEAYIFLLLLNLPHISKILLLVLYKKYNKKIYYIYFENYI